MALISVAAVSPVTAEDPPESPQVKSLLISDGSRFVPKDYYPRFSWEVTPQYFMFGDTQRILRPEEVQSIAARTDFLCIEKSHGLKMLGAAELGAKHEAAAFKAIKPDTKVLFYFNSAYAWPFTSYNQPFTRDKIDQYPALKALLLVDPESGELAHRRNIFCFDVLNPRMRQWWVDTVAKGVADSGCDGAFYGWGWTLSSGSLHDYPELHKPLGAPKGAYQRTTPEAWEFTREFERASVWVNTDSQQAKITWR